MNFNLYLDRDAAARLTRLAKIKKTPRNALIRQAVQDWLVKEDSQWPEEVMAYGSDAKAVPFESHRSELSGLVDDPFGTNVEEPGKLARHRRTRLRRK